MTLKDILGPLVMICVDGNWNSMLSIYDNYFNRKSDNIDHKLIYYMVLFAHFTAIYILQIFSEGFSHLPYHFSTKC